MRRYKKRSIRTGKYKSKLEALVGKMLGKSAEYEPVKLQYTVTKNYIPDFVINPGYGNVIFLEVKGFLRYEDQVKMRAVKAHNPDLDIRFYFSNDRKVHGSKLTNSEWCAKYGFPCYIGKLPKEWKS